MTGLTKKSERIEKEFFNSIPSADLSNSMTITSVFKSFGKNGVFILWRPNNYRREIEVKQKTNSVTEKILRTIDTTTQNEHTKILTIKHYEGITIQYCKHFLIGIYSQNKIAGNKETFMIEAENIELINKRLEEKKQEIKEKIDHALTKFIKQFKIGLRLKTPSWLRHEDWIKGEDYIDKIPRETIIHDTVFKKVYGEGIEFIGGKGEAPVTKIKNYIKNRAIENIAPEIIKELNKLGELFSKPSLTLYQNLIKKIKNPLDVLKYKEEVSLLSKQEKDNLVDYLFSIGI